MIIKIRTLYINFLFLFNIYRQRIPAKVTFKQIHDLKLFCDKEKTIEVPRGRIALAEFIGYECRTKLYGFSDHIDKLLEQYGEIDFDDNKLLHNDLGVVPATPRAPTANRIGGPLTLKDDKVHTDNAQCEHPLPPPPTAKGNTSVGSKHSLNLQQSSKIQNSGVIHNLQKKKKSQDISVDEVNNTLLEQILGTTVQTVKIPDSVPFLHPPHTANRWGIPVVIKYIREVVELPQYDGKLILITFRAYS